MMAKTFAGLKGRLLGESKNPAAEPKEKPAEAGLKTAHEIIEKKPIPMKKRN